jgi:hypothetical protein
MKLVTLRSGAEEGEMHNKSVQAATKRGKPENPERVCPFILEPLAYCPSKRTSYKEVCPFTLEPCSSENKFFLNHR